MKCPFCDTDNTRVIDSRPADDNRAIRRRRQCDQCGRRFTSFEKAETMPLIVVKKDQKRETFSRQKLEVGIFRSLYKRPVPAERIATLIDEIEASIYTKAEKEIESTVIGEIVMDHLKDLDPVAYVRFASVYREFKDASTFMEELKKLLEN